MNDRKMRLFLTLCSRALELAREYGHAIACVGVDLGGHAVVSLRSDLAPYTALEPARRKAVAAASSGMPSGTLGHFVSRDPIAAKALDAGDEMLAVPGGMPVILDGYCIGGIGIAGGHYTEDQMICDGIFAPAATL